MNRSEHPEPNIKTILHIRILSGRKGLLGFVGFVGLIGVMTLGGILSGCSSGEEVLEDPSSAEFSEVDAFPEAMQETQDTIPAPTPKPVTPPAKKKSISSPGSQHFSVQADTVDVLRKKKHGSQPTSVSVKASTPKRFYTVEIGAFRLQSNVKRHQEQLTKRFKLPVRVLFDSTLGLTRVCVGTFSTKSFATEFMKKMQTQYPKEYPDSWVSYWTK